MQSSFHEKEYDLMMDLIANRDTDKYMTISDLIDKLKSNKNSITTAKCALMTNEELGVTYLYTVAKDDIECEITPIYTNEDRVCITEVFHIRVLADQVTRIGKNLVYNHCETLPLRDKIKTKATCISSNGRKCFLVSESPSNQFIAIEGDEDIKSDFNIKVIYSTTESRKEFFKSREV